MDKKGFTLIELLAVIVILAIIALIATPIVLNIIKDSRKSAGLRSAEMYLDAVEQAVSIEKMNNTSFNPNSCEVKDAEGNLVCDKETTKETEVEVEVNGEVPQVGSTITFENGKIKNVSLNYSNNKTIVMNDNRKLIYSETKPIKIPFEEGTLAYSILKNYGDFENIEQISYELLPQSFDDVEIKEYWIFEDENLWYGTSYSYNSSTNQFSLTGTLTQATLIECQNGSKSCGKYTLESSEANATSSSVVEMIDISNGNSVKIKSILATNAFKNGTKENESGIYKAPDDYGTSYYFRGNPINNYVSFADKIWRIVRINGDGTIRIIYNDIIGEGNYNNSSYRTHVGYMFGTTSEPYKNTNSSAVKTKLDNWYKNNLEGIYEKYISDSIFCNDREEDEVRYNNMYYKTYNRISKLSAPKLTCTQQNDRFTVNDTVIGNGALTYPIGLITADEYLMAGKGQSGNVVSDAVSFLGGGDNYWTMTPMYTGTSNSSVFGSDLNGPFVTQSGVYPDYRPVINLKVDVEFTGTGKIDDPYVILTE